MSPGTRLRPGPSVSPARLCLMSLFAAIVAGFISWGAAEPLIEHFKPEIHTVEKYGVASRLPTEASLIASEIKNAALAFSILAGTLGLLMGLAGGLARSNFRTGSAAAACGLFLGVATAIGTSCLLIPFFQSHFDKVEQGLMVPLLMHGGIWGAIGGVGGLAMGIGLGGWDRIIRCFAGGLAGGLFGAVVYELAGAALFPLDKTYLPLSESASSRLLARLAVTLCVAAAAALATQVSADARRSDKLPRSTNS
jgi:hypothetical protein